MQRCFAHVKQLLCLGSQLPCLGIHLLCLGTQLLCLGTQLLCLGSQQLHHDYALSLCHVQMVVRQEQHAALMQCGQQPVQAAEQH